MKIKKNKGRVLCSLGFLSCFYRSTPLQLAKHTIRAFNPSTSRAVDRCSAVSLLSPRIPLPNLSITPFSLLLGERAQRWMHIYSQH
ncbi:unnamed protein product [Lactuca virosa]|uniref:Secreted protein n=1 Tax=Lactuca virosa TaxID=75947 RepID=A0AAU9LJ47_9ASTR|nr:unnamed protein product [Lactuca virosa]